MRPEVGEKQSSLVFNLWMSCLFWPISLNDYLELVEWAGSAIRDDKRGYIPAHLAPILIRTGIQPNSWLDEMKKIEVGFYYAIGPIELLTRFGKSVRRRWLKGKTSASKLFQAVAA